MAGETRQQWVLEKILRAVRDHGRDHAVKYGGWPTPVVMVGRGLWAALIRECHTLQWQYMVSERRLSEGVLLMAAPGGKEAEVFPVDHLGSWQWRVLSDLGVAGDEERS